MSGIIPFRQSYPRLASKLVGRTIKNPLQHYVHIFVSATMHNSNYSSMANENLFLPVYRIRHYMADNSPAEAYECHPL